MDAPRAARRYRPRQLPIVELDHGRVLAAEPYQEVLRELGLDTVAGAVAFDGGEVVRVAGPRVTRRIETAAGALYLKSYARADLRHRWLGWLLPSRSPGHREWDNLRLLRRAWFDVPEMVAVGDAPIGPGRPCESFLVLREIPGRRLDHLLEDGWGAFPGLSAAQARDRVVRDVAGLVRRLHSSGFYHRDLYLAHFVVTEDERWGRPYLIDLQRVEQRFPPRRRWLVKDLAAMAHSAPVTVTRADRLRFLLHYLCKSRVDPQVRQWVRAVTEKEARIAAHEPKFP